MGQKFVVIALALVFVGFGCKPKKNSNDTSESVQTSQFNSNLNGAIYFDSKDSFMRLNLSNGEIESFLERSRNMTSASLNGDHFVTVKRSDTNPEILIMGRDKNPYVRIALPENPTGVPKLSPSADFVLIGGIVGETKVYDLQGRIVANLRTNISGYDWLPDGRILFSRFGTLYVTDLSFQNRTVYYQLQGAVNSLSISPDGKQIALEIVTGSSHIWVLDMVSGKVRQITTSNVGEHFPSWSPDARYLILAKGKIEKTLNCLELWIANAQLDVVSDLNSEDLTNTIRVKQNVAGQVTETCATATPQWRLD